MKNLCIICEGRTEVNLVENLLFERLYKTYNVVKAVTLPTGNNPMGGEAKGGFRRVGGYNFAKKQIQNIVLLQKEFVHTTFFDLFRFPNDIACFASGEKMTDPIAKAELYENQMGLDILEAVGDRYRFLPYVQPCEAEAFLFVNPTISAMEMGGTDQNVNDIAGQMEKIRVRYATPEHINTGKGPSKHLEDIFPGYGKNKAGRGGFSWRAAKEIGFEEIFEGCEHLRGWIHRLEIAVK